MNPYRTIQSLGSAEAFREYFRALAPDLDCRLEVLGGDGPLAQPVEVAGLHIGNRLTAHPMEGWDAHEDGSPSAHTLRRWRNFGRSGCKLIWGGEAFAVERSARANPEQLFLNDDRDNIKSLAALRSQVVQGHQEMGFNQDGLVIGLQLTHSGRWSRPSWEGPAPKTAFRHPVLDKKLGIVDDSRLLKDEEIPGLVERFAAAARAAEQAGFDFVDVKACHGYLLHEFLAARTRSGPYGGSFENRTRLFREIVAAIRSTCPHLVIGVRVSIVDILPHAPDPVSGVGAPLQLETTPYRSGFGVDDTDPTKHHWAEPFAYLALLRELGISLVNLTIGSPYTCPHLQRPAAFPPSDGYQPPEDPLLSVGRHLRVVRTCKAQFKDLLFVGTGYSYLQEYLPHVAEYEVGEGHVDSVGLGRLMLAYPEFARDLLSGSPAQKKRLCRTFSDCTTGPRNGTISGCFPLDPYYREMPEAKVIRPLRGKRMDTA